MKARPKARHEDLVVQNVEGEVLVYDLKTHTAAHLDRVSALVWEACDGRRSVPDIAAAVSLELGARVDEDVVWLALDGLKAQTLLAQDGAVTPTFNGLSRREVIRRIGLTSAAAIPVITGMVVPRAAQAQSITCGSACQCSGLLAPVSVCPEGFAECPAGCDVCVIADSEEDCFQVENVWACNGTCVAD